jgi:DeoR family fructose operon transcriptional repressor
MVAAASRVVCMVDHSKVGLVQLCRFASLDVVDVVITDSGLEQDLADELAAAGPEVVRA